MKRTWRHDADRMKRYARRNRRVVILTLPRADIVNNDSRYVEERINTTSRGMGVGPRNETRVSVLDGYSTEDVGPVRIKIETL